MTLLEQVGRDVQHDVIGREMWFAMPSAGNGCHAPRT
jgi:hypothetical protein